MKSKTFLLGGILIIILIAVLVGVEIYNGLNNENISPDNLLYCLKDSDCASQAVSCNGCDCPIPVNINNQIVFKCAPLEMVCNLYCPLTIPKCLNKKCTLIEQ